MRYRYLFLSLLLCLFCVLGAAQQQQAPSFLAAPYAGAQVQWTGFSGQQPSGGLVDVGTLLKYKHVISNQQFQLGLGETSTTYSLNTSLTYDGNVLYERAFGKAIYGAGVRATRVHHDAFSSFAARPYFVIGKREEGAFYTVKFITPGNDGFRKQWGVLGQGDLEVGGGYSLYATAGLFSYHAYPGRLVPVFVSNGVTKYEYFASPRELAPTFSVGIKYWFHGKK